MAYGIGKENEAFIYCEKCNQKILVGEEIVKYGPELISWFDGNLREKAHWYCSSCAKECEE